MKQKNLSTFKYCLNVSKYIDIFVVGLPENSRPNESQLIFLKRAALIHDIGKLCVLDEILLKDDKLTNEEYEAIKDHVSTESYLFHSPSMRQFMSTALCHHLWFDDSKRNYPLEYSFLKEQEIPYFSRIISVIDAFEAMTGDRTYKHARSLEDVIEVIEAGKGTQFDPEIATTFVNGIRLHSELEDMLHTVKSQKLRK